MVVDQFNVKCVRPLKAEHDAPIRTHGQRPQSLQVTLERVQPIARNIQSLRRRSRIQNRKDSFNRLQAMGLNPNHRAERLAISDAVANLSS